MNTQSDQTWQAIITAVLLVGLAWLNVQVSQPGWGGQAFLPQWAAGKMLAMQAQSPYLNDELIRSLDSQDSNLPASQTSGLNTPLYSLIFVLPWIAIERFETALIIWLVILEVCMLVIVRTGLSLTSWKPGKIGFVFILLFAFFSLLNLNAILSGSLAIVGLMMLLLALVELRAGRNELAGLFLALATIQPQTFLLPCLFIITWAVMRRRPVVLFWFLVGIAFLTLLGMFVIPAWPLDYLRTVWRWQDHFSFWTPSSSLAQSLPGLGRQLGWGLALIALVTLILEWRVRHEYELRGLVWTVGLTLTAAPWLGLPAEPGDFMVYLFPLLTILAVWDQRMGARGRWLGWGSLLLLTILPWLIASRPLIPDGLLEPPQQLSLILPFLVMIGMYWVRWWAIRPLKLFVEELRENEAIR